MGLNEFLETLTLDHLEGFKRSQHEQKKLILFER